MAREQEWQTIPIQPLTGALDTRSRPADLSPGAFRYKLNMAVNRSGKLSRRSGFSALNFGRRSDWETNTDPANWDFHKQKAAREPITLVYQDIAVDGTKRLFVGTESGLHRLNNSTSEWDKIASDIAAPGTRWKAASLGSYVVFTNNATRVRSHNINTTTTVEINDLIVRGISRARVIVEYAGVLMLMNMTEDGSDKPSRIRWTDWRKPLVWETGQGIANFQDLDYGDDILAAAMMNGFLHIFTIRSIWRVVITSSGTSPFGFHRIYSEPKNQTGCLAYPNTLVSTGRELYWMGRDSIYTLNQYISTPISPDWLLKSCGHIFQGPDAISQTYVEAPVADYVPSQKEIWFSYRRQSAWESIYPTNDASFVLSSNQESEAPYRTADIVDAGFTAFTSFGVRGGAGEQTIAMTQFIGASSADWCLKTIGGVFYRTYVNLGVTIDADIGDVSYSTRNEGYYSRMVGLCPFGNPQRDKLVRNLLVDHDTVDAPSNAPNQFKLAIGNSYVLADPASTSPKCSVQWHEIGKLDALCVNGESLVDMQKKNLRPDLGTEFVMLERGRYLYYDLNVQAQNGAAPTGGDIAFSKLEFESLTLP